MNPFFNPDVLNRRAFLCRAGASVGTAALANLLAPNLSRAAAPTADKWPGVITQRHHAPKVKRVIQLYMAGGPSHLETFDYKPKLAKLHGEPMSRKPTPDEQQILLGLEQKHAAQYAANKAAATELLQTGGKLAAKEFDPVEFAAWISVSRTILNLHETITRN